MSEVEQFVPTPAQVLYGAAFGHYTPPDWVWSMLTGIMHDWERVYGNVNQKSWPNRWDQESTTLGSVYYRPYAWGSCDCGGKNPTHTDDCRFKLGHPEWNRRRLDALSEPNPYAPSDEEIEAASGETRLSLIMLKHSKRIVFAPEREARFIEANPCPECSCEAATWEEHECADNCIANLPNFGIEGDPVEIRWYKHYQRGLSVNLPLTTEQWIEWHDRVQKALHDADEAARRAWYKEAQKKP